MVLPSAVLYRGPLSSCNYRCEYCPFAKRKESREELAKDRGALERFVAWVAAQRHTMRVFFTPWGEALVRRWYQEAFVALSAMSHVERVCAQTNRSWKPEWLERCALDRVALWCTFHPGEIQLDRFVRKCRALDAKGVRYSVGIVATHEHYAHAVAFAGGLLERVPRMRGDREALLTEGQKACPGRMLSVIL